MHITYLWCSVYKQDVADKHHPMIIYWKRVISSLLQYLQFKYFLFTFTLKFVPEAQTLGEGGLRL